MFAVESQTFIVRHCKIYHTQQLMYILFRMLSREDSRFNANKLDVLCMSVVMSVVQQVRRASKDEVVANWGTSAMVN